MKISELVAAAKAKTPTTQAALPMPAETGKTDAELIAKVGASLAKPPMPEADEDGLEAEGAEDGDIEGTGGTQEKAAAAPTPAAPAPKAEKPAKPPKAAKPSKAPKAEKPAKPAEAAKPAAAPKPAKAAKADVRARQLARCAKASIQINKIVKELSVKKYPGADSIRAHLQKVVDDFAGLSTTLASASADAFKKDTGRRSAPKPEMSVGSSVKARAKFVEKYAALAGKALAVISIDAGMLTLQVKDGPQVMVFAAHFELA